MNCLFCNKPLKSSKSKYCNNTCQQNQQYINYIKDWKDGKISGLKGKYQISNHIRKYLLIKYNYKCAKCGWGERNPYTKIIPLEIEHIDGNYLNNHEDNLIVLCPNCHSLTATYKGANKGNGRKDRKKYSLYGNPELGNIPSVETLYDEPKS